MLETINDFLNLFEKNTTKNSYRSIIIRFKEFLEKNNLEMIYQDNEKDIYHPLILMKAKEFASQATSISTKNTRIATLKSFYMYLSNVKKLNNPLKYLEREKTKDEREELKQNDFLSIMKKIDRNTIRGKRDYALILLFLDLQISGTIIRKLSIKNITVSTKSMKIGDRDIKIEECTFDILLQWLKECYTLKNKSMNIDDPIWPSLAHNIKPGSYISSQAISMIMKNRTGGYSMPRMNKEKFRESLKFL